VLTVCASKYEVPTHKASKLDPDRATVIAGSVAATMTASTATTMQMRQIMNIVSLNLKDFFSGGGTSASRTPWSILAWLAIIYVSTVEAKLMMASDRGFDIFPCVFNIYNRAFFDH